MEAINKQLLGTGYELKISGIDELMIKHDSPMLEAVNTSFQVHFQVSPENFAPLYNIAQVLAAPVMAIAANSPLVFGRRLWHESRIAMFQQSIDTRSSHKHLRERLPRVYFGKQWVENGILDIYKDDIARFRVLMTSDVKEKSLEKILAGEVPKLKALQVHNSTIYRWNRPCYGISDTGKPHLRIENRVFPAGPTVSDEVANAVFWLGLMVEFSELYPDIRNSIGFADARDNFFKAATYGIDSTFSWIDDKKVGACELTLQELIPMSRQGLHRKNIDEGNIDKYLGLIEDRAKRHMNGARWILKSYTKLNEEVDKDEALSILTSSMLQHQEQNLPITAWPEPNKKDLKSYRPSDLTVEECMRTDLFTVNKNDILELVGEVMDWRQIRHMPVESEKGKLEGLVTHRLVLHELLKKRESQSSGIVRVADIMVTDPITANPGMTIQQAMHKMRENKIGCLPVVGEENELIGLITEMDFLRITARLLDRLDEQQ